MPDSQSVTHTTLDCGGRAQGWQVSWDAVTENKLSKKTLTKADRRTIKPEWHWDCSHYTKKSSSFAEELWTSDAFRSERWGVDRPLSSSPEVLPLRHCPLPTLSLFQYKVSCSQDVRHWQLHQINVAKKRVENKTTSPTTSTSLCASRVSRGHGRRTVKDRTGGHVGCHCKLLHGRVRVHDRRRCNRRGHQLLSLCLVPCGLVVLHVCRGRLLLTYVGSRHRLQGLNRLTRRPIRGHCRSIARSELVGVRIQRVGHLLPETKSVAIYTDVW